MKYWGLCNAAMVANRLAEDKIVKIIKCNALQYCGDITMMMVLHYTPIKASNAPIAIQSTLTQSQKPAMAFTL